MTSDIAVIMSVYKSESPTHLKLSIESILSQTLPTDLYIYIDGEIDFQLHSIINDVSHFKNVHVYSNFMNRGLAYALNFLIEKVMEKKYRYIARMDSDDISHKDRIKKQFVFLEGNQDIDVCGTFCKEFGASYAINEKKLPTTNSEIIRFSITRCPFIHPTVMFRSSIFEVGHRYPMNSILTEDMALWFELIQYKRKLANLSDVLLDYRLNEETIVRRKGLVKAINEIRLRTNAMINLKQISVLNILLISSRLIFHFLPSFLLKLAYKKAR